MVIDCHIHLPKYETSTKSFDALIHGQWGNSAKVMQEKYNDPKKLLKLMDECNIEYAVILAELAPITTGIASNEQVAKYCAYSDRLIPFASINPYTKVSPAKYLDELVNDFGFRGLKLYPTYQYFFINDPIIYPIYAKAQEFGLPVSIHTGSSILKGSRIKYGDPLFVDDVAVDFPELILLMCHCGRPFWYKKSFYFARFHTNIYMELSGIPPKKLLEIFPRIESVQDKLVYGSDWPTVVTIKENIQEINKLDLSDTTKKKILGANAAKILKIS